MTRHHSKQWQGSPQLAVVNDEGIAEMHRLTNQRVRPTTDPEFVATWASHFIAALCAENWERVLDVAREATLAAARRRAAPARREEIIGLPLTLTTICNRTLRWLDQAGVTTVGDLLGKRREDLMAIPQFGPHCLQECLTAMRELGFGPQNVHETDEDVDSQLARTNAFEDEPD